MIGKSIDIFHRNPEHQRRLLADPKNQPIETVIALGPESLNLLVLAILDKKGNYVGPLLTWELVTDQRSAKHREAETARKEFPARPQPLGRRAFWAMAGFR